MADIVIKTALFPDGREPVDMGELTRWIHTQNAIGHRAALMVAVLIAHARDTYYPEEPSEWLAWARKEFSYERRFCFRCLAAGRLLLQCTAGTLDGCDLAKLELLWPLARQKPEQFAALISAWNPAEHSREEVSAKVAAFLGSKQTAVCAQCEAEFEPTKRKQELCPACEERKAKESAARKGKSTDKILGDLAGLDEPEKQVLAREVAPGVALRAGCNAIELAFMAVDQASCWADEDFAYWEPRLAEVIESFRYLATKGRAGK